MLYGLETVALTKRQEAEMEVAELKMLPFSLGVTRMDNIINEYIRGTAQVGRFGKKIREVVRLRWMQKIGTNGDRESDVATSDGRNRMVSSSYFPALVCTEASCAVERSSSVVERRTRNQVSAGSNPPPPATVSMIGHFSSLHWRPCSLSCINEYLAIDSGGNVSDLVLARNCCMARMLPGEAEFVSE